MPAVLSAPAAGRVEGAAGIAPALSLAEHAGDFERWEAELARAGVRVCTHPVRLRGTLDAVDPKTGELHEVYTTGQEPSGVLLKGCGNRREAVCPACAEVYRRDARRLILSGLAGGDGIPASASAHPRVFATFTAPSFGPVHTVHQRSNRRCHPRRRAGVCPHGVRLECRLRHRPDDPRVGEPLCVRCYDYEGMVVWNAVAGKLWSRTSEYLYRALAHLAGLTLKQLKRQVRLEFARVAEFQRRGVVHFHAVIRLDAKPEPGARQVAPPPAGFTVELLERAVRLVVEGGEGFNRVTYPIPGFPAACWGRAGLDVRPITQGALEATLTARQVAVYIAKYATKATEALAGAGLLRRLTWQDVDHLDRLRLRPHVAAIVHACWALGGQDALKRSLHLRRWAHQFGFGGHWSSRSRRYSTTFRALRAERQAWARQHAAAQASLGDGDQAGEQAALILGTWAYDGRGYLTEGERRLALQAAARARAHREQARALLAARAA